MVHEESICGSFRGCHSVEHRDCGFEYYSGMDVGLWCPVIVSPNEFRILY